MQIAKVRCTQELSRLGLTDLGLLRSEGQVKYNTQSLEVGEVYSWEGYVYSGLWGMFMTSGTGRLSVYSGVTVSGIC